MQSQRDYSDSRRRERSVSGERRRYSRDESDRYHGKRHYEDEREYSRSKYHRSSHRRDRSSSRSRGGRSYGEVKRKYSSSYAADDDTKSLKTNLSRVDMTTTHHSSSFVTRLSEASTLNIAPVPRLLVKPPEAKLDYGFDDDEAESDKPRKEAKEEVSHVISVNDANMVAVTATTSARAMTGSKPDILVDMADFDAFHPGDEEEREIELRRQRRQAIMEKYQNKRLEQLKETASNGDSSFPTSREQSVASDSVVTSPSGVISRETTPEYSAADYDPAADGIADDAKRLFHEVVKFTPTGKGETVEESEEDMFAADYVEATARDREQLQSMLTEKAQQTHQAEKKEKMEKEEEREIDLFAPEGEDLFDSDDHEIEDDEKNLKGMKAAVASGRRDDWDDIDGYYRHIIGELLDNRYYVFNVLGKGVFSTVVKARDLKENNEEVAIKIIRNNDTMYRAGQKEISLLLRLKDEDPAGKKHVIRMKRSFEHRKHLCLVFESLHMNLREVLKKFGKDVGINIKAVRIYAQQTFLALSLLRKARIIHADIKPDNILVNEAKNILKLCDLGSASDASENDITPYLVSRFYRAPEIILGLSYDYAIDVWSIGCTLYELFTGRILFPGRTNNQMLRLHMELKGRIPNKMLKRAHFSSAHFDEEGKFLYHEHDKVTNKETVKKMAITKPVRDMKSRLMRLDNTSRTAQEEEREILLLFVDFLEKCLNINPEKRMTPKEALQHPFLKPPIKPTILATSNGSSKKEEEDL